MYNITLQLHETLSLSYRMSKDCKNEDMRGEVLHLELRRKMHCFAYNALMAIIANTQVNPDFYRSFLFSGDAIKVRYNSRL